MSLMTALKFISK